MQRLQNIIVATASWLHQVGFQKCPDMSCARPEVAIQNDERWNSSDLTGGRFGGLNPKIPWANPPNRCSSGHVQQVSQGISLPVVFYSFIPKNRQKASWTHWTLSQKHLVGHPQHLFLRWSKGQSPGERTAHSPYAPGFDFCFACFIWLEQWFTFQGHQVYKTSLKRFFIQDPSECTLPKGYGVSRTRRNCRCPHNQGISA